MNRRYVLDAEKMGPAGKTILATPIVYAETAELARGVAQRAGYDVNGPAREEPLYEPGTYGPDAIAVRAMNAKNGKGA